MEMTYPELEQFLRENGLFIRNLPFAVTGKNEIFLTATITAGSARISIRKGAVYSNFSISGNNPDELVKNFWKVVKGEKLLVGTSNNYGEIIEWTEDEKSFKRRPLSRNEELDLNCIY